MYKSAFTAAAVLTVFGLTAAHASALTGTPEPRAATACNSDGVATLCVSASVPQDSTALSYQVTQLDGPGSYTVSYTDTTTGQTSASHAVGPLAYQARAFGTLYGALQDCFTMTLVSTPGTSLTAGPVCA
jgi:hypothetical protein